MTDEQRRMLEQQLWKIANDLRGKMGADEFRDYILGLIFYKYLSEKMESFGDRALAGDGLKFTDLDESLADHRGLAEIVREQALEQLGYHLAPDDLFGTLAMEAQRPGGWIIDRLEEVLRGIENSTVATDSQDDFDHLFEDLDLRSTKLGRTDKDRNALIAKVLVHLDGIDFAHDDAESDLLGDAYEYLLGQFASGAGKRAGEFYTPQAVSTVLARIVSTGKERLRSVYDPTCGSGSLLLRVRREMAPDENGHPRVDRFFGQESIRTTFNLARMNMLLHGVHYRDFDLQQDDTLEAPRHKGEEFEAIVANPPFSAKWSVTGKLNDPRFAPYGRVAPASKADFAFIQHMLHHLADDGIMAVVLPHGVLFRSGAEGEIRRVIVEKHNVLDAVIGLPANIFYGTGIPTAILVMRKDRAPGDPVLFVDASSCFEKGKNQNRLTGAHVERIVEAYRARREEERFSHLASLEEIRANEFNLNIPRYVDSFEAEEQVDLAAVTAELRRIEADMAPIDAKIRAFCAELGLEAPV